MQRNRRGFVEPVTIGVLIAITFGVMLGYGYTAGQYQHEGKPVPPPYQQTPGR